MTGAHVVGRGGTPYLLTASTDPVTGVAMVKRYHDSDSDGYPDQATEVELFSTDPEMAFLTSFAPIGDGSEMLVLDRRCQDVWLVTDTTSDGWPDTVAATPWACSSEYSELEHIRGIGVSDSDGVWLLGFTLPVLQRSSMHGWRPEFMLGDTDLDGEPDEMVALAQSSWSLEFVEAPYAGASHVRVAGGVPLDETLEVWKLDTSGANDVLLGSAARSSSGEVPLSPPLVQGDRIAVQCASHTILRRLATVEADVPQVHKVEPSGVGTDSGTTQLTVRGANLSVDTILQYREVGASTWVTLSSTFISSGEMTCDFIAPSEPGMYHVRGILSGQNTDDDVPHSARFDVWGD